MNRLPLYVRAKIIQLIVEGNSLRSCSRITDTSITTVSKLLVETGKACLKFHSQNVIKLSCTRLQIDEQWSFVSCKQKRLEENQFGKGSVWLWVAMDPDTKLVVSFFAGERNQQSANFFINDVWCRLKSRTQLSTDGYPAYIEAVADTFGGKIDFAQLVKQYGGESDDSADDRRGRYSGAEKRIITGNPDLEYTTTSHIERLNLTHRMSNRRFARDTNAFSKKYENHCYSIALSYVHYNFVRIHSTLRITPAMEAGLTKRFMTYEDIANLSDAQKS